LAQEKIAATLLRDSHVDKIILYDGSCVLCNRAVRFLLKRDTRQQLKIAPLQGDFARTLHLPEQPNNAFQTVLYVTVDDAGQQRVFDRSDAILTCLVDFGGLWRLTGALKIIPRAIRDFSYNLIARHRYRWFGRYVVCPMPEPDIRDRFLP